MSESIKEPESAANPLLDGAEQSIVEVETNVHSESGAVSDVAPAPKFRDGDRIMAIYNAKGGGEASYPGKVAKIHVDLNSISYDIDFDDGDYESKVSEEFITSKDRLNDANLSDAVDLNICNKTNPIEPSFTSGEVAETIEAVKPVEAETPNEIDDTSNKVETPATVVTNSLLANESSGAGDDSYDHDEFDFEPMSAQTGEVSVGAAGAKFKLNDRVEGQYQGKYGKTDWYSGKISAVNEEVTLGGEIEASYTFNIQYDDGDFEQYVEERFIRSLT